MFLSFRILCNNWKDGLIAISGLIWISHIQKFIIFVMVLINWSHTCWCLWNYIIHKKEQCVFRIQVYSFSEKSRKNQSILFSTISTSCNRTISRSWKITSELLTLYKINFNSIYYLDTLSRSKIDYYFRFHGLTFSMLFQNDT